MNGSTAAMLAIVLISAGLSGCLGPSEQDPMTGEMGEDDEAIPEDLQAGECREQLGIFPVEDEAVRPYMPPGFEPMPALPPDAYQGEDPSEQSATLLLVAFSCTEPRDVELLFPFVPVSPPEEMRVEEAYYHAVALPCIADATTATTFSAWNIPCATGTAGIEASTQTPAGAMWELEATAPDATVHMEGSSPALQTPAGPEWIRVFHVEDQEVCALTDSRVDTHEHWQFGPATLEVTGAPPFPVPPQPGMASLGLPGFGMSLTPVTPSEPGYAPSTGSCT